jgi:hypothetical protein
LKFRRDIRTGNCALLVVTAAGTERVPQAALGELGVGGSRGDLQDAVFSVDFRSRDRNAGVEVADHELDAVSNELVGNRNALLRIGDVVAEHDLDLLAIDAASSIDVSCACSAPFWS